MLGGLEGAMELGVMQEGAEGETEAQERDFK